MASTPINWDELASQAIRVQKLISEHWVGSESPLLSSLTEPQGLVPLSPDSSSELENVVPNINGEVLHSKSTVLRSPLKNCTNVKSNLSNNGMSCVTPVKTDSTSFQCPTSAEFKEFLTGVMEVSPVIQDDKQISPRSIHEASYVGNSLQTSATNDSNNIRPVRRIRKPTFNLNTSCESNNTTAEQNVKDTVENCDILVAGTSKQKNDSTLDDLNVKDKINNNDVFPINDSIITKPVSHGLISKLKCAAISIPDSCDLYSSFSSDDKSCDSDQSESEDVSDSELLIIIDDKPKSHKKPKLKNPKVNVTIDNIGLDNVQPTTTAIAHVEPTTTAIENFERSTFAVENVQPYSTAMDPENEDCTNMKAEDFNVPLESNVVSEGQVVSSHKRERKGTFELVSKSLDNVPVIEETVAKPINSGDNKSSCQNLQLALLLKQESLPVSKTLINMADQPRPSGIKPPGVKPALMRPGELQSRLGLKRPSITNKQPELTSKEILMTGGDASLSKTITKSRPTISRLTQKQLLPPQKTKGGEIPTKIPEPPLKKIPLLLGARKGVSRESLGPMKALPLLESNTTVQSRLSLSYNNIKSGDNGTHEKEGPQSKMPLKKTLLKFPSKEPIKGLQKNKITVSKGSPRLLPKTDKGMVLNDGSRTVTKEKPLVGPGTVTKEKSLIVPGTVTKEKPLVVPGTVTKEKPLVVPGTVTKEKTKTVVKEKPQVLEETFTEQKHQFDDTFSIDSATDEVQEFKTPKKNEKIIVPRRLSHLFSISSVTTGSGMNGKYGKQSLLPTPNRTGHISSVFSTGSTTEFSFRKPSPFTNKKGNEEDLEAFKSKSLLVKNTPDVQHRRLSMWSPVQKQAIRTEERVYQCTKRLCQHQDGSL